MTPAALQPHRVKIKLLSAASKDASGGTATGETVLADKVPCLISMGSGRPDTRFAQPAGSTRYRISGTNPYLARTDTAIEVLVGPRAGETFKVIGCKESGPGVLTPKVFTAECEELTSG